MAARPRTRSCCWTRCLHNERWARGVRWVPLTELVRPQLLVVADDLVSDDVVHLEAGVGSLPGRDDHGAIEDHGGDGHVEIGGVVQQVQLETIRCHFG